MTPEPAGTSRAADQEPSRGQRAAFTTALALAMGTGTFPGFAFGVLGPPLVDEMGLSRVGLGLLTTCFFAVGGVGSLSAGKAVDRFGARTAMLVSFLVVVVALVAMAVSPGYPWLLVGAAAAGVALATGNPATNKAISERLPPGRRGLTTGVKQAGVQVGAFLTGLLLAPAAATWGWRPALAVSALVPLVGLVFTWYAVPADEPPARRDVGTARPPLGPIVWGLAVYAFLMGAAVAANTAYLPLYAVERVGMSAATAGVVAGVVGFVGVVGRVVWGWGSERLPNYAVPLMLLAFGATVAVAMTAVAPLVGAWALWLAAIVFGATAVTWNSVGMLALMVEVDASESGHASGVVLFGFYTGFVGSPLVFGAIVDATDSYTPAWALVAAVLAGAGTLVLLRHRSPSRRRVS